MTPVQRQLLIGAIVAFVVGIASGVVCLRYGASFLFGFLTGFVLVGLVTLFVMAVGLENAHQRRRDGNGE